jgi:hypothetical protein
MSAQGNALGGLVSTDNPALKGPDIVFRPLIRVPFSASDRGMAFFVVAPFQGSAVWFRFDSQGRRPGLFCFCPFGTKA